MKSGCYCLNNVKNVLIQFSSFTDACPSIPAVDGNMANQFGSDRHSSLLLWPFLSGEQKCVITCEDGKERAERMMDEQLFY
jgi:hypothetical protein